jgi:hypothetical protein
MNHNPYQPPAAAAGFQSQIPTGAGHYEFTDYENLIIDKLAGRVRWWGGLSLVFGAFALLAVLGGGLAAGAALMQLEGAVGLLVIGGALAISIPVVLIYVVTGSLYLGSGKALRDVVHSQGSDVPHMLTALQKMGRAFKIELWVSILGYAFMILAIGGVFIVALTMAPQT